MSQETDINFDNLLIAISEDRPTGADCREGDANSLYYQLKSARDRARDIERNNLFNDACDDAREYWLQVIHLAPEVLKTQTKDLEVTCWFCEALVREHGFSGLHRGLWLTRELIDRFWQHLYPLPDEDGLDARLAPLCGLNGETHEGVLLAPIRNAPLWPGGPSHWDFYQANEVERIADDEARVRKAERLNHSLSDLKQMAAQTSIERLIEARDDIDQALVTFKGMNRSLTHLCGVDDAPPSSRIESLLTECIDTLAYFIEQSEPSKAMGSPETHLSGKELAVTESSPNSCASLDPQTAITLKGFIAKLREAEPESAIASMLEQVIFSSKFEQSALTRQSAFHQITQIAQFFRQSEPHSPVPYLLERALKWGRLSLAELAEELIPNDSAFEHFSLLTGIVKQEHI